jgi:hypothetical protein
MVHELRDAGLADASWDLDGSWAASLFAGVPSTPPGEEGNPFPDRVVLLGSPDAGLQAACRAAGASWHGSGPSPPGERVAAHCAALWGGADLRRPWLRPWALGREAPAGAACGALAVHPGSGSAAKNWPVDRWIMVLRALRTGPEDPVVVVEGPADLEPAADLRRGLDGRVIRLARAPIDAVASTLVRSRLYLGNDSGISHLAGLVGAPSVIVFGPTDPAEWKPAGPRVAVVTPSGGSGPVAGVDPAAVTDVGRSLLNSADRS